MLTTEWGREEAVGFWATSMCWGIAAGAAVAFQRADLWLEAGLCLVATYAFAYLLKRTWTEGRV